MGAIADPEKNNELHTDTHFVCDAKPKQISHKILK